MASIGLFLTGAAHWWWERSPNASNSNNFTNVNTDGNPNNNNWANNSNGVCLGFCEDYYSEQTE